MLYIFKYELFTFTDRASYKNVVITVANSTEDVAELANPGFQCFFQNGELDVLFPFKHKCNSRIKGRYVRYTAQEANNFIEFAEMQVVGWKMIDC